VIAAAAFFFFFFEAYLMASSDLELYVVFILFNRDVHAWKNMNVLSYEVLLQTLLEMLKI
jgi:hypothetical protein